MIHRHPRELMCFLKPPSGIGGRRGDRKDKAQKAQPPAVSIPQAKTIAEANELAVQLGLAQHADFRNADVGMVNDMLEIIARHRQDFPEQPQLEFIGTMPEYRKYVQENYGYTPKRINNYLAVSYGRSRFTGRGPAIVLNSSVANPQKAEESIANIRKAQEKRFLSIGTVRGVIHHEEGHQLDNYVGGSRDSRIQSLYRQHRGRLTTEDLPDGRQIHTSKMAVALSAYANKNIQEFIAEGWAEYRTSSKPRPLARQIGDRMMELYKEASRK